MTERHNIELPHRQGPLGFQERRPERRAGAWRYDAELERLIAMKDRDPAGFRQLPASVRMQLGYYASAKAAAGATGIDTDPPEGTAA